MQARFGSARGKWLAASLVAAGVGAALLVASCGGSGTSGSRGFGGAMAASGGNSGSSGSSGMAGSAGIGMAAGASGTGGIPAADGGPVIDAGPDAPAPECLGKTGTTGLSKRTLQVGLFQRSFELYIPPNIDLTRATPVVFVHHGFSMSGEIMRVLTGFTDLADEKGFIVVFPDGELTTWDQGGILLCGLGAFSPGLADDFGFVEAVLGAIDAEYCLDRTRVFTTGFSMGGYFSNHIGCKRPDLVRAIAPHSGGGPPDDCGPPKPVMILHGSLDLIIVPRCGDTARDKWVAHNGCSTDVDIVQVQGGTCEWHRNCLPGGQVVYCSFDGMIHGWAGRDCGAPTCLLPYGGGPNYEDATRLVWDFFEAQ